MPDEISSKKKTLTKEQKRNLTYFIIGLLGAIIGFGLSIVLNYAIPNVIENNIGTTKITLEEDSAIIDVVDKVSPSVVSITAEQSTLNFFGQLEQAQSAGTGFIVTADGLIVTNKHVAENERASYSVFTKEGKEYEAKVVATDPYFDIAFLKIEAEDLPVVELGDSDEIQVGGRVIAIGNALGQFQNTVTSGVVSAIGRSIEATDATGSMSEVLENMIQTDAAINSGNSGGPLVNIGGQVIGMNTAVASSAEGIGFATPINLVKKALESYQKSGKIVRPMLGVRYISISKEFAARNNLPVNHGALVYSSGTDLAVLPGTPAARAGLREGDIITKVGDHEIEEGQSLVSALANYAPGEKVDITFIRDESSRVVSATLAESS
ncbi:MAG: trypsin-like peptidase domain-containing protein [Patescibacteria group bacterium]|nr:trypsin-like peptidase domain-containing protein [Patescibacteria group bacterium]